MSEARRTRHRRRLVRYAAQQSGIDMTDEQADRAAELLREDSRAELEGLVDLEIAQEEARRRLSGVEG